MSRRIEKYTFSQKKIKSEEPSRDCVMQPHCSKALSPKAGDPSLCPVRSQIPQRMKLHSFPGQPVPVFAHPYSIKMFPDVQTRNPVV